MTSGVTHAVFCRESPTKFPAAPADSVEIEVSIGPSGSNGLDKQDDYPRRVLSWYFDTARPVVQRCAPSRLVDLDDAGVRLKKLADAASSTTTIGLLGHSNIGKTSLLNAILVGRGILLPADGAGPCTAQATHVSYAEQPHLRAFYRETGWVQGLLHQLEEGLESEEGDLPLDPMEAEAGAGLESAGALARLLVTGDPMDTAPIAYLAACLRIVLGQSMRVAGAPSARDADRLRRIRKALEAGRHECSLTGGRARFQAELALHAAGFLAPLTARLELGWKSSVLRDGLCLVDLPGVGIAADPYQDVAQEWMRTSPQAIALVVDTAGVTQDAFELLRSSGIFGRILESAGDPSADPVALLVVVTKADLTAQATWLRDTSRPWHECLAEARETLAAMARRQVGTLITRALEGVRLPDGSLIARIKSRLRVEAITSAEFAKLIAKHPADPARIQDRAQSGLPVFVAAMHEVVKAYEERRRAQTLAAARQLDQRLRATLYVARERASDTPATPVDVERTRRAIESRAQALKTGLDRARSDYRDHLVRELPQQFEQLAQEARSRGDQVLIGDYIDWLDGRNYQRLLATLRKGGRWNGIHIARDLAERFVEPISASWKHSILQVLRDRSLALAATGIKQARSLADSLEADGLLSRRELVDGLMLQMEAEAESLSELGSDIAKGLRVQLRDRLLMLLEAGIASQCQRIAAHEKGGPGAKRRLLRGVERMIHRWLEDAEPILAAVLRDIRHSLADEARRSLERLGDPLSQTVDAILLVETSEEGAGKLSRSQRRTVAAALDAAPEAP